MGRLKPAPTYGVTYASLTGANNRRESRNSRNHRVSASEEARCAPGVRRRPDVSDRRRSGLKHLDRKSTRLNSSHLGISYAVFCLKKKKKKIINIQRTKK